MYDIEIGIDEDVYISGDWGDDMVDSQLVGFSFGKLVKGIGKAAKGAVKVVTKAAPFHAMAAPVALAIAPKATLKSYGQALKIAKPIIKSPITKAAVTGLAVAFPAVGIPAAGALAAANLALDKVQAGVATAKTVNANLSKLKNLGRAGDPKAQVAVNAMQVAMAARKAMSMGRPAPKPVALPGRGSFSITPNVAVQQRSRLVPVAAARAPQSLYAPTQSPASVAARLAAGGSALGQRALSAVSSGQSVGVPEGVVVVPGQAPIRGRRVWVGRAPAGVSAAPIQGAHAVTKRGYVFSGQSIYVA